MIIRQCRKVKTNGVLYSAERLNAYSDADEHPGLFSVTITGGQITNVDILRTEYNKYFVFSTGVNCDDSNFKPVGPMIMEPQSR